MPRQRKQTAEKPTQINPTTKSATKITAEKYHTQKLIKQYALDTHKHTQIQRERETEGKRQIFLLIQCAN